MFKLFTDGGSRGNPGPAATGYFLFDRKDKLVNFGGEYIGSTTNNIAEYLALLRGIKLAKKHEVDSLTCYLDSELVVKQLNGEYKVKNENIKPLYEKVIDFKDKFEELAFIHIPREKNAFADRMVNIILDTKAGN